MKELEALNKMLDVVFAHGQSKEKRKAVKAKKQLRSKKGKRQGKYSQWK